MYLNGYKLQQRVDNNNNVWMLGQAHWVILPPEMKMRTKVKLAYHAIVLVSYYYLTYWYVQMGGLQPNCIGSLVGKFVVHHSADTLYLCLLLK